MADDPDPADVFALLDDEYARSILAATSHQPMTASELGDQCDMSISTVYRRLAALEECGLVETDTAIDPDGHHDDVYEARLDRLTVDLDDGSFEIRISTPSTTREFADAFTDLWEGL